MPQLAYNTCAFIFQVLTFAAVVVAVVAIWLQQRVTRRQLLAHHESLRRMMLPTLVQHLESPDVRAAACTVREELHNKPLADWTTHDRAVAAEALSAFDLAGALARRNAADSDLILDHWSHTIVALCRICREYIAARRAQEGQSYFASLLWLEAKANRALADEFQVPPQLQPANSPHRSLAA